MATDLTELQSRLWEAADQLRANSGLRSSEYSMPVLGLAAVVVVGAVTTEPTEAPAATEELIEQARRNPEIFARLMEQLFGAQDTWFRTTEVLLADTETRTVEYKQTARWNVKEQRKDKTMEEVIVKTVAGFLNSRGGTLLIGVADDRTPMGLTDDYALVRPPNADGYVGWLDTLFENALGHVGAHRLDVRIDVVDGQDICRLTSRQLTSHLGQDQGWPRSIRAPQ